jgi:hypothetical protein
MPGLKTRPPNAGRILACLLISFASVETLPGESAHQARDAGTQPTVGTASISGVVQDDGQPARPVRRAVVTLTGDGLHPSRGAITNDEGRFTLRGLPAGRFMLTAERGGYVTSAYGAKRPGRAGTAITVNGGQQIAGLHVRLWRGAVLSGVLRNEWGEPLPNTAVAAIPTREVTPVALTLSNSSQTRTNDLGEYRIFGLEPGTYVVRAGIVEGIVRAEVAASEAEVDAVFAALAARARQPVAIPAAGAVPQLADRIQTTGTAVGAAPIYFPGTPVAAHAAPIALEAGEERGGLDFVVQRIRTTAIRGMVVGPDGTPVPRAFVQLAAIPGPVSLPGAAPVSAATSSGADGTFELSPISPGDYRLLVRGAVASGPPAGAAGAGPLWWAETPVLVTGDDVDLARLTLEPGMTFSGRVVVDDGATSRPPNLTGLRVQLEAELLAAAPSQSRRGGAPGPRFLQPATIGADGSFSIADLVPDTYRVTVTGGALAGSGWWLRAAMWQGRDLLDDPLRLTRGDTVSGVALVLSDRRTELSGTLTTPAGAAFPDVFVLAFPADAALRLPRSRRVQAVRPDSSGRFVFANLPAGDYLLAALTDIDDGQWHEPGFFDPLVSVSVRVTLGDGETKVQDLRVGGG